MSLSHEFALGSCRLRLQAEIINLTDEQYDVIKYYPMPGLSLIHIFGQVDSSKRCIEVKIQLSEVS